METPLITVGIPVFNEESVIARCIMSVIAQTSSFPLEILVIDDGSTDNTVQIVELVAKKYSSVRVLKNSRNMGRPFTRTRLLNEARGKFYAMLDADDFWYPNKLALQMQFLKELNYDPTIMVCGNLSFVDQEAGTSRVKNFAAAYSEYSMSRLLKGDNIPISQVAIGTTAFLRSVGEFDARLSRAQDWDYLIRFFKQGGQVKFIEGAPVAVFNFKRSGRNWREIMACLQLVVAKHISLYADHGVDADAALDGMRKNYVSEFKKLSEVPA